MRMRKRDKMLWVLVVVVISAVLFLAGKWTRDGEIRILKSVQDKEMVLGCDFYDGYRTVPASVVVDFADGRFYFDNDGRKGSAETCELTPMVNENSSNPSNSKAINGVLVSPYGNNVGLFKQ